MTGSEMSNRAETQLDTTGEIELVSLTDISDVGGLGTRRQKIDHDHAARLVDFLDDVPPITLRKLNRSYQVIDGAHRLHASTLAKRSHVRAIILTCTDAEAVELAIKANISHGLPLDLEDRRRAAKKLLTLEPHWSDVRIGDACGLSDKTVADMRSTSEVPKLNKREGRDGKTRPTPETAKAQRQAAEEIAAENPDATVREIAEQSGVSIGTAANIKKQPPLKAVDEHPASMGAAADNLGLMRVPSSFRGELAFKRSNPAQQLALILDYRVLTDEQQERITEFAAECPAEYRKLVAHIARQQIACWEQLAQLDQQPATRLEVVR